MFPYTKKQRTAFLKRFGVPVLINDKEQLVIIEKEIVQENDAVSETLFVTTDSDFVNQEDTIKLQNKIYRIAYIKDDTSGLVDCYLSLKGGENGRETKYY